ncbi:family 43 glycosylhydrolase [Alicyclobacillus fodiniaquatilis]|uniref:Family 43 glycosylhydrolase n=1 Tax=Alicyclobacillus fodiniaquatilis TaxID=1661150 RepID=A0ABW4JH31_9BACL
MTANTIGQKRGTSCGWNKYENNPVLGGEHGTCFDLSVLKDNGVYKMYFSWRPKQSIALSESLDGINWSEPIIVLGPRETKKGWEDELNRPVVVRRNDEYHMWYTGQYKAGQPDGHSWIFYATSPDGIEWTRRSLEPVLTFEEPWEKVAVMCPHVIWDESSALWKMWYSGGEQYEPNAIGYATSKDGLQWNKLSTNPIFECDPNVAWEQHKVAGCQVVKIDGWYFMFYIGYYNEHYAQVGLARSKNGVDDWERHIHNPIIAPDEGAWDGDACYKPYAIFDGQRWVLWYNGRRGAPEQIGVAFHEGKDLGFSERLSANNR